MARYEIDSGMIVLPKRLSLAVIVPVLALIVGQVFFFGFSYARGISRIERLEAETKPVMLINERTIRMEEQLSFIKGWIEKQGRH